MDDSNNISTEVVHHIVHTDDCEDEPHNEFNENATAPNRDNHKVQNIICFCIIGLCNGFGLFVMLSATFDILKGLDGVSENLFTKSVYSNNSRDCMETSPAILLLANAIPALLLRILLPFLPFYVSVNMVISCVLASGSFIIVGLTQHKWHAIMGIIFMSICAGLGDTTAVAYLTKFIDKKNLLLAYSTGGGASGVAASLTYAALIDVGFTPKFTLYLMLVIPLFEFVAFLFIKESNAINLSATNSSSTTSLIDGNTDHSGTSTVTSSTTFSEKMQYLPKLIKYFNPLLINYICECVINQMFDLLYVPRIWLSHADQYRYLQVLVQIGAFAGRASLSVVSMDDVWPLNLLIATLSMYLAYEAIFMPVNCIWIIFLFVILLGFVSGCTSINVIFKLTNETPSHHQVFAISSVSTGVTLGVIVASILAIPAHTFICNLPLYL